jgi:hypothetical protein
MQPKMGKMDIDYQVLHDAFFRYQTKPKMTGVGEVYYEGKEFEANHEHIKPGKLSEDLREALGMPPGAPPPWLIYMQRCAPRLSGKNQSIPRSFRAHALQHPAIITAHGASWMLRSSRGLCVACASDMAHRRRTPT